MCLREGGRERNCPIDKCNVCLVCCSPVDVLMTGVEVDVELTACENESIVTVVPLLLTRN